MSKKKKDYRALGRRAAWVESTQPKQDRFEERMESLKPPPPPKPKPNEPGPLYGIGEN